MLERYSFVRASVPVAHNIILDASLEKPPKTVSASGVMKVDTFHSVVLNALISSDNMTSEGTKTKKICEVYR